MILRKHTTAGVNKASGPNKKTSFFNEVLHPSLNINKPGDAYEQQADAMADKIMRAEEGKNVAASVQEGKADRTDPNNTIPADTKAFMQDQFGYDFSNVQIHNDTSAHQSAASINALAYTQGNHIYFGENQYQPQHAAGKHLLAHELTHVTQQKNSPQTIQRKPATTTPTPAGGINLKQGGFELNVGYITITGLPDVNKSAKEKPHQAHTYLSKPSFSVDQPDYQLDPKTNLVSSFKPYKPLQISITIETNYGEGVVPSGPSDYGYGTRAADVKAKNTSIQFHEGSHGSLFIQCIQKGVAKNPLPQFEGTVGMTKDEFLQKDAEYLQKVQAINQMILDAIKYATVTVDCAGISIDTHNAGKTGYVKICP
ncbi:MAG: DUF4157 domain-containing protein [Chitinophagaceae bacterium]